MDVTVRGTYEYWFGVFKEYNKEAFAVGNAGSALYSGYGNTGGGGGGSVVANGRHVIDFDKGVVKVDGAVDIDRSGQTFQLNRSVYLFLQNRPSGPYVETNLQGTLRCHSCQIYDDGTLVRDYVPALKNGVHGLVYGLYDKCSGTFSESANSAEAFRGGLPSGRRIAVWTGRGNRANVNDPLNWAVTNELGEAVANGVPDSSTFVSLQGSSNFTCSAEQSLACDSVLFSDVKLAEDCDWSGLANGEIEYLDAPCGSYIDTGFKPNQNSRVVMDVTVRGTYEYWFGVFKEYNKEAFAVGNAGSALYSGYGNTGGGGGGSVVANGRHVIDFDKGVVKVDDVVDIERPEQTFQLDRSIYLFLQNRPGGPYVETTLQGTLRCHSCQIYDNGTLVRDYVPMFRNGVYGLYDKCSGTFSESANSAKAFRGGAPTAASYVGNIDLADHKLMLPHSVFSSGTITDTAGGGELHLNVDSPYEATLSNMTLSGSLKLVKEGAGVLVCSKAGQTYTGGTLVSGGWLKRGVNDRPFGPQGTLITVEDGAAFDWCGGWENSKTSTAYSFSVKGSGPDGNGAIVSSVPCGTWDVGAIADLELTGDALIGGYGGWGFNYAGNTAAQKHTIAMNGHTLNIRIRGTGTQTDNTGVFHFRNVTTTGSGTIAIIDCGATRAWVYPSFFTFGSDLSSVTFDLGEGYCTYWGVTVTVGTFIDRRSYGSQALDLNTDSVRKALTVLDRFKPMTTNLVRTVTLGDATHLAPLLDLSELDGPFVLPANTYSMGAAAGAKVRVHLGERKTSSRTPIVSWTTPPSGVSFAWPDGVAGKGSLVRKEDGLYVVKGSTIIVK